MNNEIKDGGPAFPGEKEIRNFDSYGYENGTKRVLVSGMSLRDWFAGKAMAAIVADPEWKMGAIEVTAEIAYEMADAMLEAREKW